MANLDQAFCSISPRCRAGSGRRAAKDVDDGEGVGRRNRTCQSFALLENCRPGGLRWLVALVAERTLKISGREINTKLG